MLFNQALHKKYSIFCLLYLLGFSLYAGMYATNDVDECNENKYFNYNGFNQSHCTLRLSTEKDAVLTGCNFSGCKIQGPKTIYLVGCSLNEVEFDSNITKVHLSGCSFNNLKFAPNTIIISDQTNAGYIDNMHLSTPDVMVINDQHNYIQVKDPGNVNICDGSGNTVVMNNLYLPLNQDQKLPDVVIINDHGSTINYGSLESMVPAVKKIILIPFLLSSLCLMVWIKKKVTSK